MSYENARKLTYHLGSISFTGSPAAQAIIGPKGKAGVIRDIHLLCSQAFTWTTSAAAITLGTASDADAYAQFDIPVIAATDAVMASTVDTDWKSKTTNVSYGRVAASATGTQIEVAFVAPVGAPTGTALVTIEIDWDL